jgi:hypothetical protein
MHEEHGIVLLCPQTKAYKGKNQHEKDFPRYSRVEGWNHK